MQTELDGGSGKVTYKDYIRVINNYLIPFFGKYDIANVNVKLLKEYEAWRDAKMGLEIEQRELHQEKEASQKAYSSQNCETNPQSKIQSQAEHYQYSQFSIEPCF